MSCSTSRAAASPSCKCSCSHGTMQTGPCSLATQPRCVCVRMCVCVLASPLLIPLIPPHQRLSTTHTRALSQFGLGLFSVLFDILFIVQHYVLYRHRPEGERTCSIPASHNLGCYGLPATRKSSHFLKQLVVFVCPRRLCSVSSYRRRRMSAHAFGCICHAAV